MGGLVVAIGARTDKILSFYSEECSSRDAPWNSWRNESGSSSSRIPFRTARQGRVQEDLNLPIKLWVDADALPNEIKDVILRASRRLSVEEVFVANKIVSVPDDPLVSFVRVTEGLDVADSFIVEASSPGDLCVTADIPLASRLV